MNHPNRRKSAWGQEPSLIANQRHAQHNLESDKARHPGLTRMKLRIPGVMNQIPSAPAHTGYSTEHEAARAAFYAIVTDAAPGVDAFSVEFGILSASCVVLASEDQIQALRSTFGDENVTPYWRV